MPVQMSNDAGVRNLAYNSFNELEIREGYKASYNAYPCLWLITWDPTQPVATRPLVIQKDGTWYTYGWDLTKNICEVFGPSGYIRSTYTYTPFDSITATGDVTQPIQWSSESYDNDLALVYYNYRHYNPTEGRWINRDPIAEQGGWNLYGFLGNYCINIIDYKGLIAFLTCNRYENGSMECKFYIFDLSLCKVKDCEINNFKKAKNQNDILSAIIGIEKCIKNKCLNEIKLTVLTPIYTNYDEMKGRGPIPSGLYRLLPKLGGDKMDKYDNGKVIYHYGTPSPTDLDIDTPGTIRQKGIGNRECIRIHGVGVSKGCITTSGWIKENDKYINMTSPNAGEGYIEKVMMEHFNCGGTFIEITDSKSLGVPIELLLLGEKKRIKINLLFRKL